MPVEGRSGDPPAWPLSEQGDPGWGEREMLLWRRLWAMPQAVQWEQAGQDLEVALYVRRLVEVEQPGAGASLATLVRQMADALGLTIPGLRVPLWSPVTETGKTFRPRSPDMWPDSPLWSPVTETGKTRSR